MSGPDETPTEGLLGILAVLVRHEVDFIVIGGVAVGHHGYPRATRDVDVVPSPVTVNLERLWGALVELEATPLAQTDLRADEMPEPLSRNTLRLGGNWDLSTRNGRLDIIQYREGALESAADYERLRANAVAGRYGFGTVWVAGYDDLIDLKTLAGRDQDLIDIRAMREANEDTGPS